MTPATRTQAAYDNSQAAAREARLWTRPRWGNEGERLDWCLSLGTDCGRPAALAFCQRKRHENVDTFGAELVGNSARTRTFGSNQVCSGPNCTAFAHITCIGEIPPDRVFSPAEWKGYRLDVCLQWGTNYGKPAADAFCRAKGFSESVNAAQDPYTGYKTLVIGTNQICNASYCRGFQQITCK